MALPQILMFRPDIFLLQSDDITDNGISSAAVSFTVGSGGTITKIGNSLNGITYPYNWKTPTIGSTAFFVRATLDLGDSPTGTLDTWLATSSNRIWSLSASAGESFSSFLTIEIASDSGGTTIVASASITLVASTI